MKTAIFALILSLGAFATDGYHSYDWQEEKSCPSQDCIVTESQAIGFVSFNDSHHMDSELNTTSTLVDVLEGVNSATCYQGSVSKIFKIVKGLAKNSSREYYAGGHEKVSNLGMLTEGKNGIRVVAIIRSDYVDFTINKLISACK